MREPVNAVTGEVQALNAHVWLPSVAICRLRRSNTSGGGITLPFRRSDTPFWSNFLAFQGAGAFLLLDIRGGNEFLVHGRQFGPSHAFPWLTGPLKL